MSTTPEAHAASVAYLVGGQATVIAAAVGSHARGGRPLTPADPARTASITKSFTAAAILRLVELERIALDEPFLTYMGRHWQDVLDEAGLIRDATVRDLLLHRAGLPDYAESDAFNRALVAEPQREWSLSDKLMITAGTDPPPQGCFHYSDTGYLLLGLLVEAGSGMPLAESYRSLLRFRDLGLDSLYLEGWEPAVGESPAHTYNGEFDASILHPSFDNFGGGGIIGTSTDLVRFASALAHGEVLKPDSVCELAREVPIGSTGVSVGLGLFHTQLDGLPRWGHTGYWGGFMHLFPGLGVALAGSTNTHDTESNPESLDTPMVDSLERAVLKAAVGHQPD